MLGCKLGYLKLLYTLKYYDSEFIRSTRYTVWMKILNHLYINVVSRFVKYNKRARE